MAPRTIIQSQYSASIEWNVQEQLGHKRLRSVLRRKLNFFFYSGNISQYLLQMFEIGIFVLSVTCTEAFQFSVSNLFKKGADDKANKRCGGWQRVRLLSLITNCVVLQSVF